MRFKNVRTTVILLGVFVILAVYFFLVEKENPSSTGTPTPSNLKMFDFASNQAAELTLSDGTKKTVLRREDEKAPWKIVEPIQEEADSPKVNSAVERMSTFQAERVFTDTATIGDLAQFGLTKPKFEATVKTKDGKTYVLHVGDKTPNTYSTYVQRNEEQAVYVVNATLPNDLQEMLDKPPIKPTPTPTFTPTVPVSATVSITATVPLTISPSGELTTTGAISGTPAPVAGTAPITANTPTSPTDLASATVPATLTPIATVATPVAPITTAPAAPIVTSVVTITVNPMTSTTVTTQ